MHSLAIKIKKVLKSSIFIGAFWLTLSGVLSRVLGFLYRIFLSRKIGAESLGLYQLIVPIFGLCICVCSAGIQSAISRYVADAIGNQIHHKEQRNPISYLYAGLTCSLFLAFSFFGVLYGKSDWIAVTLLGHKECAALIRLMAFALLPASVHSCINGYYFGKRKTVIPAVCQFAEQCARVLGVYLLYQISAMHNRPLMAVDAVWGLLFGEICSSLISITALSFSSESNFSRKGYLGAFPKLLSLSIPLTLNQALTHLCTSAENILIPQKLIAHGYHASDALSIYGVFSGMVLSVIFFPCVLTNSIAVVLLPSISQAKACDNHRRIEKAITNACVYGLLFGICFSIIFCLLGNWIGNVLFENELAGQMIQKLCWICPLLFIYALLISILNGLGKSKNVLYISLLASGIRIGMILLFVPRVGMDAVLYGMLLGQLFSVISALYLARRS